MSSTATVAPLPPSHPELFPYTRRFLWPVVRWCLRAVWRFTRFWFTKKGLFTIAILATLLFAAVVVENVRGRKAWEACKAKMEAQGFDFNWRNYDPPNVPADQNAARHPFFAQFFDGEPVLRDSPPPGRKAPDPVTSVRRNPKVDLSRFCQAIRQRIDSAWDVKKEFKDLAEWKRLLMALAGKKPAGTEASAAEILEATQEYEAAVAQMAEAFQRPHFVWFDTAYTQFWTELPAMSNVFSTTEFIVHMTQLRYPAFLEIGDHDKARREVECLIRFSSAKVGSCSIVQALVEMAQTGVLAEALPDILKNPAWNKEDLAAFSRLLETVNLPAVQDIAFRKETAIACNLFTSIESHPEWLLSKGNPFWVRVIPTGWFYQNAVTNSDWKTQSIHAAYDPATRRFNPEAKKPMSVMAKRPGPYTLLAMIAMPAVGNVFSTAASGQTKIDQCRLLCALRRHFLTAGAYPDSLDVLVPRYLAELPHDWVTGEAPSYMKSATGLKLWTTGWDEKDDGGDPEKDWSLENPN